MKATLLGTGTSSGVPVIGCDCPVCLSDDPRNRRRRTGLYLEAGGVSILVDTPPDFREQALEYSIPRIDAVFFTHSHADHIFGFDDIRRYNTIQNQIIPAYAHPETIADLKRIFDYIGTEKVKGFYRPRIEFRSIEGSVSFRRSGETTGNTEEPRRLGAGSGGGPDPWPTPLAANQRTNEGIPQSLGYPYGRSRMGRGRGSSTHGEEGGSEGMGDEAVEVVPLPVIHGPGVTVGYMFKEHGKKLAYVPDCSMMPDQTLEMIKGVDVMILDALRHRPHKTHLTVEDSVKLLQKIGAKRSYITHMCHDLDHEETEALLPDGMRVSYDGMMLEI